MATLGAVDFRSDKERIARYTKQTRNAVRAGNDVVAANTAPMQPAADLTAWAAAAHKAMVAQAELIDDLRSRVDELEDVVAELVTGQPVAPELPPPPPLS